MFNVLENLKIQTYLNNQNFDADTNDYLLKLKFNELYTPEEFMTIKNNVDKYRTLDEANRKNPTAEVSKVLQELSQDILYQTGQDASKVQLAELNTTQRLDQIMMETPLRSKNDLYVRPNYDDYKESSNYIKCEVVGHDNPYAYGIAANARMCVTPDGTIITTKNALYMK